MVRIVVETTKYPRPWLELHGEMGIGKTALALALIHEPRIREAYMANRYFVSCECLTSISDLVSAIEACVTGTTSGDPHTALLSRLARTCEETLIVLDDLDFANLRPGTSTLSSLGDFFQDLDDRCPKVVLVTTSRSKQLPKRWTKLRLGGVDRDAASRIYSDVSRQRASPDGGVLRLVDAYGCVPIAIRLLAGANRCGRTLASIIGQYDDRRVDFLVGHRARSPGSVKEALKEAVLSLRARTARHWLVILSQFPAGVGLRTLEQLQRPEGDLHHDLKVLEASQLILLTSEWITMPRSIRDTVCTIYKVTPQCHHTIKNICAAQARSATHGHPRLNCIVVRGQASALATANNLCSVFRIGTPYDADNPPDETITEAVVAVVRLRSNARSALLDLRELAEYAHGRGSEYGITARCTEEQGWLDIASGHIVLAYQRFVSAVNMYRMSDSNIIRMAWCELGIGQCYLEQGILSAAEFAFASALNLFQRHRDVDGAAHGWFYVGLVHALRCEFNDARRHLGVAWVLFDSLASETGVITCETVLRVIKHSGQRQAERQLIPVSPSTPGHEQEQQSPLTTEDTIMRQWFRGVAGQWMGRTEWTDRDFRSADALDEVSQEVDERHNLHTRSRPSFGDIDFHITSAATFCSGTLYNPSDAEHVVAKQAWYDMVEGAGGSCSSISSFQSLMM